VFAQVVGQLVHRRRRRRRNQRALAAARVAIQRAGEAGHAAAGEIQRAAVFAVAARLEHEPLVNIAARIGRTRHIGELAVVDLVVVGGGIVVIVVIVVVAACCGVVIWIWIWIVGCDSLIVAAASTTW
jgi:hypothetical protein